MRGLLDGIALAHNQGYALRDFDPAIKTDRIRVAWHDDGSFDLKIIDWNITGNEDDDRRRDLLYFGGHLLKALTGISIQLEGPDLDQVPAQFDLDVYSGKVSPGAKLILQRALHKDSEHRYSVVEEIQADMDWWISVWDDLSSESAVEKLQLIIQTVEREKRYDRILAIADAVEIIRKGASDGIYDYFADKRRWAHEKLNEKELLPLRDAKFEIEHMGNFKKAIAKLSKIINEYPSNHETARLARLYLRFAQDGEQIREITKDGTDVRNTSVWKILQEAVNQIEQGNFQWALSLCQEVKLTSSKIRDLAQAYEYQHIGRIHEVNQEYAKAKIEYARACQLISDEPLFALDLARVENIWGKVEFIRNESAEKKQIRKKKAKLHIKVAFPKKISKRKASKFIVNFFVPSEINDIEKFFNSELGRKRDELIRESSLYLGHKVQVSLISPDIEFLSDTSVKILSTNTQFLFLGKPKDNCQLHSQQILLTVKDASTNEEYKSFYFSIEVVDLILGFVSRPLLSNIVSIVLGISSMIMFFLTFVGQIDTSLGLTSGTTAGILASAIYARFFVLYQSQRVSVSNTTSP